ncbi:MAG: hypothetical protein EON58_14290 [Alphaproteobacteria bacterium]|nr:MAG: hypothetical protein EON58_14290 [Alphaproteobacteria bacterium]
MGINWLNVFFALLPLVFARLFAKMSYGYYKRIGFDALSEKGLAHCFRGVGVIMLLFELL